MALSILGGAIGLMTGHWAVRALIAQKADVNAPQADGATAMHWAAYHDDVELVDLLIRAGASVTAANRHGATPLALACINGSARMIQRLLKGGAAANEHGMAMIFTGMRHFRH